MGLIIKKISLINYATQEVVYSKMIRGNLDFFIEPHNLDKGQHIQIYFYREHPRIKDFIEMNEKRHHLTEQKEEIQVNEGELKLCIDDHTIMLDGEGPINIKILEYNFNQDLVDFKKGKVSIFIDINYNNETDNSKAISALRALNKEEDILNEKAITRND